MINKGTIIGGRYEILKEIDKGGMSIVYLAYDIRLKKNFAIKDILKQDNKSGVQIDNELLLKCLKKEAELLVALEHPNLPKIYDIITGDEHIYVVMDYIAGETLKKKFEREGKCNLNDVINWGIQIAEVLNYLHNGAKEAVIYRDMKPHNIMLTPEGKIKLIDFGIAISDVADKTGVVDKTKNLGTKIYAAPEQIVSKITDARTDIYSFGVVMYQLITGKNFKDNTKLPSIRSVDKSIPEGLDYIIDKCLRINPNERYQSADKLLYDLKNINKLTKKYRSGLIKRIALFSFCLVMTICFGVVAVVGWNGKLKQAEEKYVEVLNGGVEFYNLRKYTEGTIAVKHALIDLDREKDEAYIALIDGYVSMGKVKEGTELIEWYITNGYLDVSKSQDATFKLAITYFDYKNYSLALKYLSGIDVSKNPIAKHYLELTKILNNKTIDYKALEEKAIEFEKAIEEVEDSRKRAEYINSLGNVYNNYGNKLKDGNKRAIDILEKGRKDFENIKDKYVLDKLNLQYGQKLAPSYKERGDWFGKELPEIGAKEYVKSLEEYCKIGELLIEIQGGLDDKVHGSLIKAYYEEASKFKGAEENSSFKKFKQKYTSLNKK
ncbi:MAG: protein kinase domain-containing protein [Clostridium sp.]